MSSGNSLDANYFDGIFAGNDDPWSLASSDYEAAKFAHTVRMLDDRRYVSALEIGCAHGVLTQKLAPLCTRLLAIDIAQGAIDAARKRCAKLLQVRFDRLAFPREAPAVGGLDLVVLSEVAYYWSDHDLSAAGDWLSQNIAPGGRILLVHYIGETDYPQTGDEATTKLREILGSAVAVVHADRAERYRLDMWTRR
ncbi:SAM-dependent methyltransferase [Sphingomonas radiodurans]|uniref:SAM-dependent methyltransferase n=1 Tax=Sphingomonas radiodurans TaxID=2890321 RepID=UPI001E5E9FA4|nr:SAM-dependent methyltransferase [Sphingomonas radiodurans]WBH15834.1 SAM-dependent methyltransferase [Sphingomonas radiodurans]